MCLPRSRSLDMLLRRFRNDTRGVAAVIFGIAAIPLLMFAGVVIDYGSNSMVRQTVQDATDSTVLSLAKLPTSTTDDSLKTRADSQVRAALAKLVIDGLVVTTRRVDNTITVTATGTTPTSIMRIAGFTTLAVTAASTATRGSGNLELALVLDNTGSMAGSKIANLKTAANDLVTTLFNEVDPTKPNALKIGIVPFSMTVNVGAGNAAQVWMDKDAKASYHSQTFVSAANRFTLFKQMNVPWAGCVESRISPYDVRETPPTTATPDTLFVPYFAPDESDKDRYGVNDYRLDYPAGGEPSQSPADRTRQGQIQKYAKNPILRTGQISDTVPYKYGPNSGCELQPITRLTTSKSTISTAINAMSVIGDTNIPMGLVWGWHLLSPQAPFSEGVPYTDKTTRKFVVLMTDGQNQIASSRSDNDSYYSGAGFIWQNRIGTTSNDFTVRRAALDNRLSTLCTNMKNAGIQIFTVRVEVTEGTSDILKNCATSPSMFYDVQNSANLTDAFRAIGAQISELRISR